MGEKMQGFQGWSIGIRFLTSCVSIASLILLLKSKQTVQVSVGLDYVTQQVKYSDTSAFVYLVFSDILVAVYCIVVLVGLIPAALGKSHPGKAGQWAIFIFDQVLAYVLLAAASSATEVAYLADKGMAKTSWEAVCPRFAHFCHTVMASISLSFVAVLLLALLAVVSASGLFGRFYRRPLFAVKMRHNTLI
uniref:CASP-like protein 2U2 n=1 Tax=Pteridium aquilinum subsp. aquilinum TaxID=104588 RepID=CSPL7_PTEAA|nr:RecName: Full=CASP-like protein 2U2; Short=PaCASPL2U2 [Pteridium aquilinum subsp. aquilinum]|eukprot:c14481_g1_i1 orf=254-826(-)